VLSDGLTTAGAINLTDAEIVRDADILGARLGANSASISLAAPGLRVGGGMTLGDGLTVAGIIALQGAKIAANLLFQGNTRLEGTNAEGNSLQADALKVRGNLFIRNSFMCNGAVHLVDAEVGGNLEGCGSFEVRHCEAF
jgi:hypothetical protein